MLLSALLSLFIETFALSRCARVWKSNISTKPRRDGEEETGEGLYWVWFNRTTVRRKKLQYWIERMKQISAFSYQIKLTWCEKAFQALQEIFDRCWVHLFTQATKACVIEKDPLYLSIGFWLHLTRHKTFFILMACNSNLIQIVSQTVWWVCSGRNYSFRANMYHLKLYIYTYVAVWHFSITSPFSKLLIAA